MGMFDTVYLAPSVAQALDLKCKACGKLFESAQTKSLECNLEDYYLVDVEGATRLRKLDEPSDKRFWHEYTDEEIQQRNSSKLCFEKVSKGDGHYTEEANLPENRRARDMGELPHGYVELHTYCRCDDEKDTGLATWEERTLKFTDGVMVSWKVGRG
jgi:hypothetical protein